MDKKGFIQFCLPIPYIILIYLSGGLLLAQFSSRFFTILFALLSIIIFIAVGISIDQELKLNSFYYYTFRILLPLILILVYILLFKINRFMRGPELHTYAQIIVGAVYYIGISYFIGGFLDKKKKHIESRYKYKFILPILSFALFLILYLLTYTNWGC